MCMYRHLLNERNKIIIIICIFSIDIFVLNLLNSEYKLDAHKLFFIYVILFL